MYELFVGPPELDAEWDDRGIEGVSRFLNRFYNQLWRELGGTDSVFHATWPECDEEAMKDDEIEVAVQVNGKVKAVIMVPADIAKEDAIAAGKAAVEGKITGNIVKEIYVPKKIVNLVVK